MKSNTNSIIINEVPRAKFASIILQYEEMAYDRPSDASTFRSMVSRLNSLGDDDALIFTYEPESWHPRLYLYIDDGDMQFTVSHIEPTTD
jgi:hypothetical protein